MQLEVAEEVGTVVEVSDEFLQDRGLEVGVQTHDPIEVESEGVELAQGAYKKEINTEAQAAESLAIPIINTQEVDESHTPTPINSPPRRYFF